MKWFTEMIRRKNIRLQGYDYSSPGLYFITICTKNMEWHFGDINTKKMIYSKIGLIVEQYWENIPCYHQNVRLHDFVVMPNHLHGILEIVGPNTSPAQSQAPLKITLEKKSVLARVINGYKSSVKCWCNLNGYGYFKWLPKYYEHIIRNENDYRRIVKYIRENPMKW